MILCSALLFPAGLIFVSVSLEKHTILYYNEVNVHNKWIKKEDAYERL